jgi:photosystem II stability/assembly factor-like uncharacterized protein
MRIVLIFIIFIATFIDTFSAQNYWIRIQSPTTKSLNRCAFTDSLNGWIAGDSTLLIHTTNGGGTWAFQNSTLTLNYNINDIFFLNQRLGWCVALDGHYGGTILLHTTDAGSNWNRVDLADTALNTVYFVDSLTGYLGGWDGLILKSTNACNNWFNCSIDSSFYTFFAKNRFYFYDQQVGLACGGIMDLGGPIWMTTNSGSRWFLVDTAGEPVNDIRYLDANTILGTGGDFELGASLQKSLNNGLNWRNFFFGVFGVGRSIAVRTRAEIWIPISFGGGWMVSFDSTRSWDTLYIGGNTCIFDTKFSDPYHGWAIGLNGSIYKYNTDMIRINEIQSEVPSHFYLFQNYPNPFNPKTIIEYQLPLNSYVILKIYDMLGREVATPVSKLESAGTHKVVFNGNNLASGIYFYTLRAGDFEASKKMILLK